VAIEKEINQGVANLRNDDVMLKTIIAGKY